ncbi:MAG: hypothetical protein R6V85_07040 [Polyangia bacterium]
MDEILIDARRTINLKQAVADAVENGEYEGLADDIRDCFEDDQISAIEGIFDTLSIDEAIDEILEEWAGDDSDELLEIIESYFADADIEVRFDHNDLDLVEEDAETEAEEELDDLEDPPDIEEEEL